MSLNQQHSKELFLIACESGNLEYIKDCLKEGLNPSFNSNIISREPIYIACGYGGHIDIVIELLNHGVGINGSGRCRNPLSVSIDYGNHEITRELVKRGANVDYVDIESHELLDSEKDIVLDILESHINIKPAKRY
jgi:ankyrin repeat protein